MKRVNVFLLLGLIACLAVNTATAGILPIANAGFESPDLEPGGWTSGVGGDVVAISDWTVHYGSAGLIGVVPEDFALDGYSGENVAWSTGSTLIGQIVGTITADTRYTLTVSVGDRDLAAYNTQLPDIVQVVLQNLTLTSSSTPVPDNGGFAVWTMVYDVVAGDAFVGTDLQVLLGGTQLSSPVAPVMAKQVQFDDVSLTAEPIPEPSTFVLMLGMALMLIWNRRR